MMFASRLSHMFSIFSPAAVVAFAAVVLSFAAHGMAQIPASPISPPVPYNPFSDISPPEGSLNPAILRALKLASDDGNSDHDHAPDDAEKKAASIIDKYIKISALQRKPADVIRALAQQAKPPVVVEKKELPPVKPGSKEAKKRAAMQAAIKTAQVQQRLKAQIVTGDWQGVKKFLVKLPPEAAPQVYGHLLRLLAGNPTSVLLPGELLPLADAAPAPLTESQVASLAVLLRRASTQVEKPTKFLHTRKHHVIHVA